MLSVTQVAAVVFWGAAALMVYVYVGYPSLLALLAPFFRPRKPRPDYYPEISVLIAAYNEEQSIGGKLEQTLALDYPPDKIEILVLSDCSTDRTDEIVRSFSDPRVRLLRMQERHGKTAAQNEGAKHARGEVLIFSDATTIYHPQALKYLACNYQDRSVGAVSGRYQYFDSHGNSPSGPGTIAFWNYENLIKTMQSRISTVTGCCGCIYSVRKSAYTELPNDIISDLVQPLWAIKKGYRVVFEDRALAYEDTTGSTAEEFAMRVRVVTRAIWGILSVRDLLNPFKHTWVSLQLWSHKVLRWMVPVLLLLLLVSNAVLAATNPAALVFLLLQLAFYLFALLTLVAPLHRRWKPLALPLYFCTLNTAALFSLFEILSGRKYTVWQTVRNRP